MKKSLFIIAATALVISCSSNDSFKEIDTQDVAIGFGDSHIGKITRSTVGTNAGEMKASNSNGTSSGTLCTVGNTMQVWGYKLNAAGTVYTTVFDATIVKYTDTQVSGTNWSYTYSGSTTPLRFWDRTASYKFYAVAPDDKFTMPAPTGSGENLANTESARKFSATGIPDVQILKDHNGASAVTISNEGQANESTTGTAVDYLVSSVTSCAAGYANQGNDANDKNVNFTFNHILSKLNVNVKTTATFNNQDSNYPQIKLTSLTISIKGVAQQFDQLTAGALTPALSNGDKWTTATTTATSKTCFAIGGSVAAELLSTTNFNAASYFVSPTTTGSTTPALEEGEAEVKFVVGYDIYYDGNSTSTSMESCLSEEYTVTALNKIQQNTINNLNITIDPKAIYFDVQSVANWSDTQGSYDVIVPPTNE